MLAEAFAGAIGAIPDEEVFPALVEALRFGPMLGERYRLTEPGMAERFAEMTAGFRAPDEQVAAWGRLVAPQVVASVVEGSRRIYGIDPDGVGALRAYLDRFWNRALAAFKDAVEQEGEVT